MNNYELKVMEILKRYLLKILRTLPQLSEDQNVNSGINVYTFLSMEPELIKFCIRIGKHIC